MKISPDKQSTQADTASGLTSGVASRVATGAQRDKPLHGPGRGAVQDRGQDRGQNLGQPPAGEDVARFRQISRGESINKDKPKPGDEAPLSTPGQFPNAEGILKAMHQLQADAPQGMPQAPQAGPGPVTLENAAAAIAQRILVSDPDLGRGQEVRIELKQDILPGTEIRISKDAHGLNVQLVTVNESSRDFLQTNQGGLVRHLQDRLQEPVQVTVRMESHGSVHASGPAPGQATGSASAQATGPVYAETTGPISSQSSGQSASQSFSQNTGHDPNQGRSRQQRNVYEEYEP